VTRQSGHTIAEENPPRQDVKTLLLRKQERLCSLGDNPD
jgi:hypothetical protein